MDDVWRYISDCQVTRPEATFMLRVDGDSMVDAGILPGDTVLVERGRTPRAVFRASRVFGSLSVISSKARSKYLWTVPFMVVESMFLLDCERTGKSFGPLIFGGKR